MTDVTGCKNGIVALLRAAAPNGVTVLVNVDPQSVDGVKVPEFACLVLGGIDFEENELLGTNTLQMELWTWDLYIGTGPGAQEETGMDRCSTLLDIFKAALVSQEPDSYSTPLERRRVEFVDWRDNGGPLYRQEWFHMRSEG